MIGRDWPCPLALIRHDDPSRVSGTGIVAAGVVWPDRRAVFRWSGGPPAGHHVPVRQVCLFDSVDEISAVHGHQGATQVVTRDPMTACADLGLALFGVVATYGLRRMVTYWGVSWWHGPAVTWRNDATRPRVEQWPGGWGDAWAEVRDGETAADEVRLAWVPVQAAALIAAHPSYRLTGRRAVASRPSPLQKSPHQR